MRRVAGVKKSKIFTRKRKSKKYLHITGGEWEGVKISTNSTHRKKSRKYMTTGEWLRVKKSKLSTVSLYCSMNIALSKSNYRKIHTKYPPI